MKDVLDDGIRYLPSFFEHAEKKTQSDLMNTMIKLVPAKFCFEKIRELPALLLTERTRRVKKLIQNNALAFYRLQL